MTRAADFWDKVFADTDRWSTRTPISELTKATAARLRELGVASVLDLGCGVGKLAVFLVKSGLRVWGVDISAVGIARAHQYAREQGIDVRFCVADAARLPFRDGSFDALVANSVLDHMSLEQARKAEEEISRVVSDSGVVFASFDHLEEEPEGTEYDSFPDGTRFYTAGRQAGMTWRFFSQSEIESLFSDFESKNIETIESGSRHLWACKRSVALRSREDQ